MMHAAEMRPAFCITLPRPSATPEWTPRNDDGAQRNTSAAPSSDTFYTRVIEHAVAYLARACFIHLGRSHEMEDFPGLSRAAVEKAAHAAIRTDDEKFASMTQDWGYRIGSHIYSVYLAGKVKPSGLRRLFLAHLDRPGAARKVCAAVIAKIRSATK